MKCFFQHTREKHVSLCAIFVKNIWPQWWGGSLEVVKMWHMGKLLCNKERKGGLHLCVGWDGVGKCRKVWNRNGIDEKKQQHQQRYSLTQQPMKRMWRDWVNSNNFSTYTQAHNTQYIVWIICVRAFLWFRWAILRSSKYNFQQQKQ